MGVKKEYKYTEQVVQTLLSKYYFKPKSVLYDIDNVYAFNWESDKLMIMKSGYAYEFEIKVARNDYEQDFTTKPNKHRVLGSAFNNNKMPNKFYYAVPPELVQPEEVPQYAGLVWVHPYGVQPKKEAPFLHKTKYTAEQLGLTAKFYHRMLSYKEKMQFAKNAERLCEEKLKSNLAGIGQEMTYDELKEKLILAEENLAFCKRKCKRLEEDNEIIGYERRIIIREYNNVDFAKVEKEALALYMERHPKEK